MTTPAELPDEVARAFLLERFQDFLSLEQGASERTHEAYGRDLARFAGYARTKGAVDIKHMLKRLSRD